MLAIKPNPFISRPLRDAVPMDVDLQSPVSHEMEEKPAVREAWQNAIDMTLLRWVCDPGQLDEDDTITPTKATIVRAIRLAETLRDSGFSAPTRIVPDAHGSIIFERQDLNDGFESVRISERENVEYCGFQNCRLVHREPWFFPDLKIYEFA